MTDSNRSKADLNMMTPLEIDSWQWLVDQVERYYLIYHPEIPPPEPCQWAIA